MGLAIRFLDGPLMCGDCGMKLDVNMLVKNGEPILPVPIGVLMLQFRMTQQHMTMCVATCTVMKN